MLTTNAILWTEHRIAPSGIIIPDQGDSDREGAIPAAVPSYFIKDSPLKERLPTADPGGLSVGELIIGTEAIKFILDHGYQLVEATIRPTNWPEAGGHTEWEKRRRFEAICGMGVKYQRRHCGIPYPMWIRVDQGTPALHAHTLFAVCKGAGNELIWRLNNSKAYPEIAAKLAPTPLRYLTGYLTRQATSQAWGKAGRPGGFIKKAARAAPVTGDNLHMSRELERQLEERGVIQPRRRAYASRAIKPVEHAVEVVDNVVRNEVVALAPPAPIWPPIQLGLPIVMPPPIDFRAIAEAKRIEAGMTQSKAAARIGIGQAHWSNTIRGKRDAFSAWRLNRLREFVGELGRAA